MHTSAARHPSSLRRFAETLRASIPLPYPLFEGKYGPYLLALIAKGVRSRPLRDRHYMDIDEITANTTDTRDADIHSHNISAASMTADGLSFRHNYWMYATWVRERTIGSNENKAGETLGHYDVSFPGVLFSPQFYQRDADPERTFEAAAAWYVDQEVRQCWLSAYNAAVATYEAQNTLHLIVHNILNYALELLNPVVLKLIDDSLASALGSPKYRFLWNLSFALFSRPTWDFATSTVTLPIDDISWVGHFNDSETMGFGNVFGLSVRGQISLSLTGPAYNLDVYILVPQSDVFIKKLQRPSTFRKTACGASEAPHPPHPGWLLAYQSPSALRGAKAAGLAREGGIVAVLEAIREALENAADGVCDAIVAKLEEELPDLLDSLKSETLASYVANVLIPRFEATKRALLDEARGLQETVTQFQIAYAPYLNIEITAVDVIDRTRNPDATERQLMDLKAQLESAYRDLAPVSDFMQRIQATTALLGEMEDLKADSLVEYERVNFRPAYEEFWRLAENDWAHVGPLLETAAKVYRPRLCERIGDLLIAIPQRIEWERVNNTASELSNLSAEVVRTLTEGAQRLAATSFRSALLAEARRAQVAIGTASTLTQFGRCQALIQAVETGSRPDLLSRIEQSGLLTDPQKSATGKEVKDILSSRIEPWRTLVQRFGKHRLIEAHRESVGRQFLRVKDEIYRLPTQARFSWLDAWYDGLIGIGWSYPSKCRFPDNSASALECWNIDIADPTSEDAWDVLDATLTKADDIVAPFLAAIRTGGPVT